MYTAEPPQSMRLGSLLSCSDECALDARVVGIPAPRRSLRATAWTSSALLLTKWWASLVFPEERVERSKVGTADNRILLDQPSLDPTARASAVECFGRSFRPTVCSSSVG